MTREMTIEETIGISADHPSLAGHFPGNPVVPGVVLLEEALTLAERCFGGRVSGISAAKFRAPLKPGVLCRVRLSAADDGTVKLSCTVDGAPILTATIEFSRKPASQ